MLSAANIPGRSEASKSALFFFSSGKADRGDSSAITSHPLALRRSPRTHYAQIARCALYDISLRAGGAEDKAVTERVYFWGLNGLVPVLHRSRSP